MSQRTVAIMRFVIFTLYFAAAISFALAAEPLKIPKWMYNANRYLPANIPSHNLASQSTCDIQNLKSCMLTFFGSIGLSNTTLPTEEDLDKFYEVADPKTAQAIKDLCSYMNNLTQCAPSTDCWTLDSMNQLGFPNGTEEADNILGTLLPYQYMCTNYYQTAVNNWECIVRTEDDGNNCTLSDECKDMQDSAVCLRNVKSKECNNDVGIMICNTYITYWNGIDSQNCNSTNLNNICDEGSSTSSISTAGITTVGGSTATGSTIAPGSTTPNAGSLNSSFYSTVLALFIALGIISLKYA